MTGGAVPPRARSRTALGLLRGVAGGTLMLQRCAECGTVPYPPRDACPGCLGADLPWTPVADGGHVLASTLVRASSAEYFRRRGPWPVGLIQADCGPRIVGHLAAGTGTGDRVRIEPAADITGRPVLLGLAAEGANRDRPAGFSNRVEGRLVRVTDPESDLGRAVLGALRDRAPSEIVFGDGERDAVDLILDTRY